MLVLSWYMRAAEMCVYTREEWVRGMARLDWSSFHQVYKVPFNATQIIGGSHS